MSGVIFQCFEYHEKKSFHFICVGKVAGGKIKPQLCEFYPLKCSVTPLDLGAVRTGHRGASSAADWDVL